MNTNPSGAQVKAWHEVTKERERQLLELGWTGEHDDNEHKSGELAFAAAAYALKHQEESIAGGLWPWPEYQLHGDEKRCLIKAGALILAELERLYRKENE